MSSLFVLLPPPAEPSGEFAHALSADGRTVQEHGSAAASLLPQARGAGSEVVALVPAACLSWHRVALPKGVGPGAPRLRAVLEGLLEEHLLDDAESLHLALQPQARGGETAWVAACDRAWLRQSVQALEQAGHRVGRIVPEFAPAESLSLHAIGDPDRPAWAVSGPEGVLVLPMSAATAPLLPPLAEDSPCLAEPAVAALSEQLLARRHELQQPAQRWIAAARSGWDLAQFEFASSGRARLFKSAGAAWGELLRAPRLRAARWGAIGLVLANLAGLNAWAWKERSSLQAQRQAVAAALTTTFPSVRVVVDPRVQMEREVASLRQATGAASGRDFETLLAALAAAAPPGRSPTALEYDGAALKVRGLGLAATEVQALSANLRGQGFGATQQGEVLVITQEDAR